VRVHDVVCHGGSRRGHAAVPPAPERGLRAQHGAVCHAVVLPADIFIGGRATCNRLRGIRTERCFAHLYPRFAARPIQRQPSLPGSRSYLSSNARSTFSPPRPARAFRLTAARYHGPRCSAAKAKRRIVLSDQRGPAGEMTY